MEVALILATMICSWASAALAMLWGMLRIARRYQSRQPDTRCHQGWSEKDFPNLVKYADPVARVSR